MDKKQSFNRKIRAARDDLTAAWNLCLDVQTFLVVINMTEGLVSRDNTVVDCIDEMIEEINETTAMDKKSKNRLVA